MVNSKAFPQYGYNTIAAEEWLIRRIFVQSGTKISYYKFCLEHKKKLEQQDFSIYNIYRNKHGLYGEYKLLYVLNEGNEVYRFTTEKELLDCSNFYKNVIVGGELGWCVDCEEEFMKESNRHKRCNTCSKKRRLNKKKEYNKKYLK